MTAVGVFALAVCTLLAACSKDAPEPSRERTVEQPAISLTPSAADKVRLMLREHDLRPDSPLRASVKLGGSTGFMYDLRFDDAPRPGDVRSTSQGIVVLTDKHSWPYLVGSVIDWDTSGSGFRFNNPNAK